MNVYDEAHKLSKALKESDEYKEFLEKKNTAYSNPKNKEMIENFKEKAFELQLEHMSGKEVDNEKLENLKKLEEVLMLNPEIKDYFLAEMRYTQMVSDIYEILEESLNIEE